MHPLLRLFKKEWRQNFVIYLLPCLLLLLVWILERQQPGGISLQLAQILVFTVPIALAGSYGLQAFDLEEMGQTRDFLLTRPLAVAQIIAAKYLSGLIFLLPLTYLWHLALVPQRVVWPHFVDLKQFWFIFYLTFIIIIYSGSFVIGALIKGPKKLIWAILGSALILVWFAFSWFELLTLAYLNIPEFWPEPLVQGLVILATLGLIVFLNFFLYQLLDRYLRNLPLIQPRSNQRIFWSGLIIIPLLLFSLNLITKPVITPFTSLTKTFLSDEDWFIAINGVSYSDTQYFWADLQGRLALGSNGKPRLVYAGLPQSQKPLTNLSCSPNGQVVSFTENKQIKIYSIPDKKTFLLLPGDLSFWYHYPWVLLIVKDLGPAANNKVEAVTIDSRRYKLARIALNTGEYADFKKDLTLPNGALAWNDWRNQLIVATDYWWLLSVNIGSGQISSLPLAPPDATPSPIITTLILPLTPVAGEKTKYRITVLSQTKDFNKSHRYNISFYDLNPAGNELQPIARLYRIELRQYRDLVICNTPAPKILVSSRRGVYRQLVLPKEAPR